MDPSVWIVWTSKRGQKKSGVVSNRRLVVNYEIITEAEMIETDIEELNQVEQITIDDIFKLGGFIDTNKPGYELRQSQIDVARLAERAIAENRNAVIEAGTGTGKSFALVAPAVLSGKRTVITTETNTLLDQYILKDLPFLKSILPVEFSFAKAKGKGNYVCRKKIDDYIGTPMLEAYCDHAEVRELIRWAAETASGDKSEPTFKFSEPSWQVIGCDELCAKKQCPYYKGGVKGHSECFAYRARKAFLEADIVVTNHTLCLLNASIGGDVILGAHQVLIVDEAHTLAEQAQSTFGVELRQRSISRFVKHALKVLTSNEMKLKGEIDPERIESLERAFFDNFRELTKSQMPFDSIPSGIVESAYYAAKPLRKELDGLRKELNSIPKLSEEDEQILGELDGKAIEHINSLKNMFDPHDNWLSFAEITQRGDDRQVTIHYKPVDVAPILKQTIFDWRQSTILASATMTVGGRFDFALNETGIPEPLTLQVESPFNYAEQCTAHFPTYLPDQSSPEYHTRLAEEIERILVHTSGRAFVLFTSYRDLQRVYDLMSSRLKYTIYRQGDYTKPVLIERFREDVHSVLFATRSFFTGVDIPGEALSCVILTKMPFRVPDEPLFAAKCKLIKARGGNDFAEYSLPLAINDLRQAFGRLIRSKSDTGVFAFLDSRAINKPYFRVVERSLPTMKVKRI